MLTGFARGGEDFLAIVLLLTGLAKLSGLSATRESVRRLSPRLTKARAGLLVVMAAALAAVETATGVFLILRPEAGAVPVDVAVTLLCAGFVAIVAVARRRSAASGHSGSFSTGVSGPAELARAMTLAFIAGATTSLRVVGSGAAKPVAAAAGAVAALCVTLATRQRTEDCVARGARLRLQFVARDRAARADGWRRARPWERHRILRSLRHHPAVIEVLERTTWIKWSWRHAQVEFTTHDDRIATVVVPAPSARLHVLAPDTGTPAVVGYTSKGVYVPRSR